MIGGSRTAGQLPLDLGHASGRSRDHLLVSPANRDAVSLIDRWPDWPSPVVVLAGPAGSGKSHLGAIWMETSDAHPLEQGAPMAGEFRDRGGASAFVDDADRGALDEAVLFHAINQAKAAGGHVLLTARRFPAAWGVRLPDLRSRLTAATVVEIHEPDDLLLAGVMAKLFADRQVEVDAGVIQFLVRRIERSLAAAISAVDRIDRTALSRKARITRALAAEIVDAIETGSTPPD